MKTVTIPPTQLGNMSLYRAFDIVFGEKTLQQVHGNTLRYTPWENDRRTVCFEMSVSRVPAAIRPFFTGDTLRVTSNQTRIVDQSSVRVTNRLKMHFVGAEFLRVTPTFKLTHDGTHAYISGTVENCAFLPPVISHIAEGFMKRNTERELCKFSAALEAAIQALEKAT